MIFTLEDTTNIGEEIGIDWDVVDFTPESFQTGLEVELEHGTEFGDETDVTEDDPFITGRIAWIHLLEDPDYYELLEKMESKFDGVRTEASVHHPRRYYHAYVLDNIVEKNPDYISPEIEKMAKDFIKKSEKSAKSLADDEEEFLEFLEDAILAGPQLGNVASGDLLELLMRNQVMGAIPLADLKAEELIRGDKIDVYDYLQAALQHLVERVALMWLRGEVTQRQEDARRDETETVVEKGQKPLQQQQQQQQQVGGSTLLHRFATFRVNGTEY